ncbi:MAG: hypothetical protein DVS81_03095 [Candidatus Accumulibacter meliphilus]|uniref:Uncharacterized protein n=1 Tax=Candidatus Accumulibacter meliphilus TaxID=2211374 RepID=A0A369XX18_9PROT|nr:MAG: hypothetical protein DVS81_03095 [Candidatus Accumulibacter meliphilus]
MSRVRDFHIRAARFNAGSSDATPLQLGMEGKARLANAAPVSIAPEPGILSVSGLDRYAGMRQLLLSGLFVDQGPA